MDQNFDSEHSARERRDHIGTVLEKSSYCSVDMHSNSQQVHPIDLLNNAVETYGIAHLLSVLQKKDLQKLAECLGSEDTPTHKRDIKKALKVRIAEIGAKKFLKNSVPDTTLHIIGNNLGIMEYQHQERKDLIEAILRQLTMKGLEKFSKKVANKEVKNALLESTDNIKSKEGTDVNGQTKSKSKTEPNDIIPETGKKRKSGGKHNGKQKPGEKSPEKIRLQIPEIATPDPVSTDDEEDGEDNELRHSSKRSKPIDTPSTSHKNGSKSPKQKKQAHSPTTTAKKVKDKSV